MLKTQHAAICKKSPVAYIPQNPVKMACNRKSTYNYISNKPPNVIIGGWIDVLQNDDTSSDIFKYPYKHQMWNLCSKRAQWNYERPEAWLLLTREYRKYPEVWVLCKRVCVSDWVCGVCMCVCLRLSVFPQKLLSDLLVQGRSAVMYASYYVMSHE